jgi:hypothetical protein
MPLTSSRLMAQPMTGMVAPPAGISRLALLGVQVRVTSSTVRRRATQGNGVS